MTARESGGAAVAWLGAIGVAALVLAAGEVRAVDFLRGDANSDGEVTISDAYFMLAYFFGSGVIPECGDTLDTDANGRANISDAIHTLNFVSGGGEAPADPFPAPGERSGPGLDMPCDSYGNGESLEDPLAALAISRVEVEGGNSRNASVTLAVSSSGVLGGLYAEIVDEAGVIESVNARARDLSGSSGRSFFLSTRLDGGVLTVGFVTSLLVETVLPAGEDVDVIRIELCLRAGTEAGEYPLTLRAGELIAGCDGRCDETSGRAIAPALAGGTIVVDSAISVDAECSSRTPPEPPVVDPPEGPPPPRPDPLPPGVELVGETRIGSAEARPGEEVELPYVVRSNGAVQGFSFSIDFDEEVLQATAIEPRFTPPGSLARPFWRGEINNANDTPGSAGVDEGYVVGAGVPDLLGRYDVLPAETDNVPVVFRFVVSSEATVTSTTLRFLDGGLVDEDSPGVVNALTAFGQTVEPEPVDSVVLIDGILNILPDVSAFFIRGDANGDRVINITDPQFTLGYLFRSTATPPCLDAADANDDGRLNVSDPIATLQVLFRGQSALPEPFDTPGADPTEDALDCEEGVR